METILGGKMEGGEKKTHYKGKRGEKALHSEPICWSLRHCQVIWQVLLDSWTLGNKLTENQYANY